MANSSLATYTNLTNNHSGKRTKKITKITPHEMAAIWTAKQCADYFASTTRRASSNYCVGNDGSIAVSVDECNRAWTSSSEANDQQAVTIEVSNCQLSGEYPMSDAAYNALIKLCADICNRTTNGTITMHKQFAATACPGAWLEKKITSGQFEKDILAAMGKSTTNTVVKDTSEQTTKTGLYRVRKSWANVSSQIGAYKSYENAKKACKQGYKVYDQDGTLVYEYTTAGYKWDYDAVLAKGDTVKSKSLAITGIKTVDGTECVNIPGLGGYVPTADVTEAPDSGDGNPKDDYLSTTDARVYLEVTKVLAVDITNNLVKVHDYWIKPDALAKKV
jgi:N-acetyl-anhydromuramyl-L-alanine amidase AmpD